MWNENVKVFGRVLSTENTLLIAVLCEDFKVTQGQFKITSAELK